MSDLCISNNGGAFKTHATKVIVLGLSCDDASDPQQIYESYTPPSLASFTSFSQMEIFDAPDYWICNEIVPPSDLAYEFYYYG